MYDNIQTRLPAKFKMFEWKRASFAHLHMNVCKNFLNLPNYIFVKRQGSKTWPFYEFCKFQSPVFDDL